MKITCEEVVHVARLAMLEISGEEVALYTEQLNAILEYADKLKSLETEGVEPTAHVLPLRNVFREDEIRPGLPREEALANAPAEEEGLFRVPRVME